MGNWIWSDSADPNPVNRFTWFRARVILSGVLEAAMLRWAASSNGQVFVNGIPLRRKMTRFYEADVRAEVLDARPHLRVGPNVISVLHHNWGNIVTFMRDKTSRAGVYVDAPWLRGVSWRWHPAEEFVRHTSRFKGIAGGTERVRFPVVMEPGKRDVGVHDPAFDGEAWTAVEIIENGPWPAHPADVDVPPQREEYIRPANVLSAGRIRSPAVSGPEPLEIAGTLVRAVPVPQSTLTEAAAAIVDGGEIVLEGNPGEGRYITLDFGRPVHGFPSVAWRDNSARLTIDLGYAEIWRRQRDGAVAVREDGWIDTESVVGKGYADRVTAETPSGQAEIPDERTARWWTVHVWFGSAGRVALKLGWVASQYPAEARGTFTCGDARIEEAVRLCDTHARATMVDGYVDTPGREDGLWIEDARLRARIAASWYGDDALRRFQIRMYAESVRSDGNSHPFPPSKYPLDAWRDWASQWIGMLYDQYLWSGDEGLTRTYWEKVRALVGLFLRRLDADGVWWEPYVVGDIRLPFRPQGEKESSGIVTPWLVAMLDESVVLAKAVGNLGDAATWAGARDRVAAGFRNVHIVPAQDGAPLHAAGIYAPGDPTRDRGQMQAAQALPTTLGLFTRGEARAVLAWFFDERNVRPSGTVWRWNNPTYFQRVLDALSHAGLEDLAWAHFRERFAPFLPGHPRNVTPLRLQGSEGGPLPEYGITREDLRLTPGQVNPQQPQDDTGSHGWYAVPLVWLHERVLGVTLAEPGGKRLRIAPQPGNESLVCGHVVTPKGTVWVEVDAQMGQVTVELPVGIEANVTAPWAKEAVKIQGGGRFSLKQT